MTTAVKFNQIYQLMINNQRLQSQSKATCTNPYRRVKKEDTEI